MNQDLTEKTISKKEIYQGKVVHLVVADVELPDGSTSKREIVQHPGAVAVIALTKENKLVTVRQFRKPLEKVIVEIPAGKLEINEEPKDCAIRELEEETGYRAKTMEYITSFYTSPGFADELIHIYFTNDIEVGEVNRDSDEFMDVLEISLEEAEKFLQEKLIHDAKTIYAILFLKIKELEK